MIKNYTNIIDYHALKNILLSTDSAGMLFEKMKRNISIHDLEYQFSDQELITAFYEELKGEMDMQKQITLYAMATALWFKNSVFVTSFFADLSANHYAKWLDHLANSYLSDMEDSRFVTERK